MYALISHEKDCYIRIIDKSDDLEALYEEMLSILRKKVEETDEKFCPTPGFYGCYSIFGKDDCRKGFGYPVRCADFRDEDDEDSDCDLGIYDLDEKVPVREKRYYIRCDTFAVPFKKSGENSPSFRWGLLTEE